MTCPGSRHPHHQAVATRYEIRDYTFRGTIDLASIRICLRHPFHDPRDRF